MFLKTRSVTFVQSSGDNYISPNPSRWSMADMSFLLMMSLVEYRGRIRLLKQVCALGILPSSSAVEVTSKFNCFKPLRGLLSLPVTKKRNFFTSSIESSLSISQNQTMCCSVFWHPTYRAVASSSVRSMVSTPLIKCTISSLSNSCV